MSDLDAAIAEIWVRSIPIMRDRLEHVERAAEALRAGALQDGTREEGRRAAHQLAGSLGSFGMADGSEVARAIEDQLRTDRPPDATSAAVDPLVERLHAIMAPRLG